MGRTITLFGNIGCFKTVHTAARMRCRALFVPAWDMIMERRRASFDLVACTHETHGAQILAIINDVIVSSTALFEYQPRSPHSMLAWFEAKRTGRFPVIGACTDQDGLIGFATYGPFRPWPAYEYSVEHSVYVHKDHRGKGVGASLMRKLIETAEAADYHLLIGVIESANAASVALHEKLGFTRAGRIREAGFKFGRWLDVELYQLVLSTPTVPSEPGPARRRPAA